MKRTNGAIGSAVVGAGLFFACGPSLEPDRPLTPEERIQQEEIKAYEAEKAAALRGDDPDLELAADEEDEREAFDKAGAKMELQRATLSAATCPDVVEGDHPKGTADLSITFQSDGSVKEATVAPPVEGRLADCILTAYQAVIVKPFREPEFTMAWELDLSGKKQAKGDDKEAKK